MSEYGRREGREEKKEIQIYPDDIQMIEDPNQWRPSRRQILIYAVKLGYEPVLDPEESLQIAEENLKKPLPNKWRRAFRNEYREVMYVDLNTSEIYLFTDIEEKAKAELEKKRAEYNEELEKIYNMNN